MKRDLIVPFVVIASLATTAVVGRNELRDWFGGAHADTGWSAPVRATAGGLTLDTAISPDPPGESEVRVRVDLHDAAGAPVDGAKVTITTDMPAMGGMAEMKAEVAATSEGSGRYTSSNALGMGGSWSLIVEVEASGASATARYQLSVGHSGLTVVGTDASADKAAVTIDPERRDAVGIRTDPVVRAPMSVQVRAVGRLTYDETRLTDVTLRVGGYVTDLRVAATGQAVRKGETLFTLYSPELFAAEQEYLLAKQSAGAATGPRSDALLRASEKKLSLWGLSAEQIAALAARGEPIENLPFPSPASGSVIEKDVVEGDAVQAGMRLFRIAALDRVWVEADVYESDLSRVHVGDAATVALDYLPGQTFAGKVAFVYPYLDPQTRTGRVRVELPNKGLALKPDMFATVTLDAALGPRLQVPASAVIDTGARRVVFVDEGAGKLRPQEIHVGARAGDRVEVLDGLREGDRVVTAGNFLVAAESRIHDAAYWGGSP